MSDLNDEANSATDLLGGKRVRRVWRHRSNEVAVEFTDGARLFVDAPDGDVELSITGSDGEPADRPPPTAELLTPPHNHAVIQLPDRHYPGVVFQGDSLAAICERLAQGVDSDLAEVAAVKAELDHVLSAYVAVLEERSIAPPFSYRPVD